MTLPRLGFVGLGWAGAMRLESLAAAGGAEVAALCDAVPGRLESSARAHPGVRCFEGFEEMMARAGDLQLDGLVIATPNSLHAPQTLAALDAGLAVFCQKPLAIDAREAREIVETARRADRLLDVDYSYRFTDAARQLRQHVATGALGRIFSLDTVFHNAYGPDKPWCFDPKLSGGGAVIDLGVHMIDLALWLLDDPKVRAVQGRTFRNGEPLSGLADGRIDDFASVWVELEGGALVSVTVSWKAHAGQDCIIRATLFGTEGGAEFRNVGGRFYDFEVAHFSGPSTEVKAHETRDWLGKAILDWARRLAGGQRFDPGIERSVIVSEVVDAVYGR